MLLISPFLHFLVAGCVTLAVNALGLRPLRRAAAEHWSERARCLWPVAVTAKLNVILLPVILVVAQQLCMPYSKTNWIPDAFAGFVGALLGSYRFDRELIPELDFRSWCSQTILGWAVRAGLWGALLGGIALMPKTAGLEMLVVCIANLALYAALAFGAILKCLCWMGLMRPADARLARIVESTSSRMNVKVKATWQIKSFQANAYAFITTGEIIFTDRMLEICDDDEIAAICAHEFAHLSESKLVYAGRLLGSFSLYPLVFLIPAIHYGGVPGVLIPGGAILVLSKISTSLAASMERRADDIASSEEPAEGTYARALEKMYRQNQMPAVNYNDRQAHPHLYDRMLAAGITPDFSRPEKPFPMTWVGYCYSGALGGLIVFVLLNTY